MDIIANTKRIEQPNFALLFILFPYSVLYRIKYRKDSVLLLIYPPVTGGKNANSSPAFTNVSADTYS